MQSTLTEEMQAKAIRWLRLGINCAEVARRLGVSSQAVWRLKKKEFGLDNKSDLVQGDDDLKKWEFLQTHWHFKKVEPKKPKRKPTIRTPYNYQEFQRKEEPHDY